MAPTRREFLAAGLGLTSSLGLNLDALAAASRPTSKNAKNILVVVELSGGNDGLNTVVPAGQGAYYDLRPTLAVNENDVLDLGNKESHLGLHPAMKELHRHYLLGNVALIPNVGLVDGKGAGNDSGLSRSHVRAAQIWHSAQPDIIGDSGWLGRYMDGAGKITAASSAVAGGKPITLCLQGKDQGKKKTIKKIAAPNSSKFGNSLATIGDMIVSGAGHKIYHIELSGFDTHAAQVQRHARLLGELSQSLSTFLDHLKVKGLDQSVLVLVHSEFGRRLKENDDRGSDHGGSGLCIVAGGAVKGGIYAGAASLGGYGDLSRLKDKDKDDIVAAVDFRTVYATILDQWLSADSGEILGRDFGSLGFC